MSTDDAAPAGSTPKDGTPNDGAELDRLRASIDNLDAALVHLLAERFKLTRTVGELKARTGLPAADPGRESRQIERLRGLARDAHLDPAFAEKFLTFIVAEVVRHHKAIAAITADRPDGASLPGATGTA